MRSSRHTSYHYREAQAQPPRRRHWLAKFVVLVLIVGGLLYAGRVSWQHFVSTPAASSSTTANAASSSSNQVSSTQTTSTTAKAPNACASNASGKVILVSISKRHLWACNGSTTAYDSAVVTGMENLPADLTPTGTFHISSKQTNLYLKGSDSTGSWNDYVNYWMPFLHNQYGNYGFHDATWRDPNAFGNIDPYSNQASHGCVETPLATAKWLYGWASVGTTVAIES